MSNQLVVLFCLLVQILHVEVICDLKLDLSVAQHRDMLYIINLSNFDQTYIYIYIYNVNICIKKEITHYTTAPCERTPMAMQQKFSWDGTKRSKQESITN